MTANASGPLMVSYLVSLRTPVLQVIGTMAWFFFVLNLLKLPLSVGLSLISPSSLKLNAVLLPSLLLGAWAGVKLASRISQEAFERAALVLVALSVVVLVVPIVAG